MTRTSTAALIASSLFLAGCHAKDNSALEHLAKAKALWTKLDRAEALKEAEAAIKADPRNKDAHFLAGEIHEDLGDIRSAFSDYSRADMLDSSDHRARLKTIRMLVGANELGSAASRISAMLGDDPKNLDALAYRALVEQRQGDNVKARRDAQQVLATVPGHPVATAAMAAIALRDKNAELALASVERGLATAPSDTTLLQLKAAIFLQQNARDKAISIYRDLVEAEPKATGFRLALADLQAGGSAVDAGERTVRDGIAAAPDSQALRLGLADYLARFRDPAAAQASLREAIAARPDESVYDMALAGDLARRSRVNEAVVVAQAAVARVKDGPARNAAKIGLARLLLGKGDIDAARPLLDDVLKGNPNDDAALMLRADTMKEGETAQAITDLLAVTARQPTNPAPFERLAGAFFRQGKKDEAFAALKRVADLGPADLKATARVVDLALSQNRPDDARGALETFVQRNPDNLDGRIATVRLLILRRDWNAAETTLSALRQLPESKTPAMELGGQIKEGRGQPAEAAELYKPLIRRQPGRFDSAAAQAYVRASLAAEKGADALVYLTSLSPGATGADAAAIDFAIGTVRQGMGDDDAAAASFDAAIRQMPTEPAAYLQQASALVRHKQVDRATATLDAALAAGAPPEQLLLARAIIEGNAGLSDQAIATYRTILKTSPNQMPAVNNFVSLLADQKPLNKTELTQARDVLRKFEAFGNPTILDTIAWADYRLGNVASAKTLLARAKADTSTVPDLRFHYGAVLIASGDKATGQALIKTVLDKDFSGRSEATTLAID